jgi:peptide/nickel transport system substrate-binding protein
MEPEQTQHRSWRGRLERSWNVPLFERLRTRIHVLTPGDRSIFYILAVCLAFTSLLGLYALEQELLVEVPAYGGTLHEGEVGSPQFINPLLAISDADNDLSTLTYAGLMGLTGEGALTPVLAQAYDISEDGKTYTFTLRENAMFSDGTPVTAEDVVFTVQKAQDPALKSPRYADWSGVRAEATDHRTVRFTLNKPYAPFLGLTTLGILPSRLWKNLSNTEFPFTNLETNPIGAGPFKITRVTRGASGLISSVTLSQNSRYVLGRPYLDSIQFDFYPRSEDLAAAVANGSVESAYNIASAHARTAPYARVFGVFFNSNEKPVYARLEVRKALSLAIDREALITEDLGGFATPIMGPVPPGVPIKQAPVPVSENLTKAAADTLTASGWSYDGVARVWKHAGAKQTLDSVTLRTSNVAELKAIASTVADNWEKLGIPVNIELYEPGDLSQNVIRPRKYEALLYGMVIGRDQDLYAFWDSQERNDPGLNIALYANKTVDTLLEEARSSANEEKRLANLQKIEDVVASEYPAAFLYSPNFTYAVPDNVYGITLPQIITPADRFATVATWYRSTDKVWPIFVKK